MADKYYMIFVEFVDSIITHNYEIYERNTIKTDRV